MLDATRYLDALWGATQLLAESESVPNGTSVELVRRTVTSLKDDLPGYDAVIVAAGAAAASIQELSEPGMLPLKLQGGGCDCIMSICSPCHPSRVNRCLLGQWGVSPESCLPV